MAEPFYTAGTISIDVSADPRLVTGAGTAWQSEGIMKGDRLKQSGTNLFALIDEVNSNGELELAEDWPGVVDLSGASYIIEKCSTLRFDPLGVTDRQNKLLRQQEVWALATKTLLVDGFGLTAPSGSEPDGYVAVVASSGATGVFAGRGNRILVKNAATGSWDDHRYSDLVQVGWSVIVNSPSLARYYWTGSAWTVLPIVHPPSGAPLRSLLFTPGGDGQVSIWRMDASHAQNPRTATVAGVSGDTLTLTAAVADQFGRWAGFMAGVSYVRVWNMTRNPIESAWVKESPTSATLQVTDSAHVAGWLNGDTIQIGDPLTVTPGRVIALDISPMMQALFGAVFRQAGIVVKGSLAGGGAGDGVVITPSGLIGSFVRVGSTGAGDGVTIIPCTAMSPISNSNLVFLREDIVATATVEIVSSIALLA